MEMLAQNEEVDRLELTLATWDGDDAGCLPLMLQLAWFSCQRDGARVEALLHRIDKLLPQVTVAAVRSAAEVRCTLVRAHMVWLSGDLQSARRLGEQALAAAQELELECGETQFDAICDAHWILAQAVADLGELAACRQHLLDGVTQARAHGDLLRAEFLEMDEANWALMSDLKEAERRWGSRYNVGMPPCAPGVAVVANNFVALINFKHGNFGNSATFFVHAYEAALSVGLMRRAILAATNVGYSFARLNDHQAALEWKQRGLDLARESNWPASTGACLVQTGETLRQMGQLPAAREMISESLRVLAAYSNSRNYAIVLGISGDLSLDEQDYQGALQTFLQLEERARALQHEDFKMDALRGQAHALAWLGQAEQGLECALQALSRAREQVDAYHEIEALKVLAHIHSRHDLPFTGEGGSATMYYLQQALTLAATIEGYSVPPEILDALAREYARQKQHAQAYQTSLDAISAREKRHSQQATNRAIAMQVRYQTERARAEGAYHRQLAAAEALRAATLQETGKTLEKLSAIGQEVTAQLDARKVFQTLYRHVQGLLNVNGFVIYLAEPDGQSLTRSYGMEDGKPLPFGRIMLSNPNAESARCAREKRDLVVSLNPGSPNQVPGTMLNRSALFAPLLIGERLLGVMAVQSLKEDAFGERERNLFRSLCAYAAIALDNANAYAQLQEAQTQLVEQEKLVALGSLVAGVAHELNTPLGNSLIIASALQMKTVAMDEQMQGQNLRAAQLQDYLADAEEAATLIVRGLRSAADLVNSFKQVAVDRTAAHRRVFDLQQTCNEIIATLMNQIRPTGHEISVQVPAGISMHSYPGPFGQVISNFINNSLLHAFEDGRRGHMRLSAWQEVPGQVVIEFADDGIGISAQNLSRIFDPFFTTKMGQGGNGLGLSISYNIVTSLLQGQINVRSQQGKNTIFTLDLPQVTAETRKDGENPGL